jgi:hypothetical protein
LPAFSARDRIGLMPPFLGLRRLVVLASAAGAILAWAPGAQGMTVLYDRADAVERALAAGLRESDDLIRQQPARRVIGPGRQAWKVSGGPGTRATPSLIGRGPAGMAALLRDRIRRSGAHLVFLDELGPQFRGRQGDDLNAALVQLTKEKAPYAPDGLGRRVHVYVPLPGEILAGDDGWTGARRAILRVGGVWLEAYRGRKPWTAEDWLTWPGEFARRMEAAGVSRRRVHVLMRGGDLAATWRNARAGTACAVLGSGPGAYRLAGEADVFAREFRRTFPAGPPGKQAPVGCTPAPLLSPGGAAALAAANARQATGLELPEGGLVSPPLLAGEPAQLTVQIGPDPLGLAAALDVAPEAFWRAASARLVTTAPGVSVETLVDDAGSARVVFTPAAPGPVTMRLVVSAGAVHRAVGTPLDVLASLRRARVDSGLQRRVIQGPSTWDLALPVVQPGGAPGSPVIEVVPR